MADLALRRSHLQAVAGHVAHAHVVWIGDQTGGSVRLRGASRTFSAVPVSLGHGDAATTPGELIAAALIAAALSASLILTLTGLLARRGTPARELDVAATCEIEADATDGTIIAAQLRVCGRGIPLDAASFSECCAQALASCSVSRAMSPGVPITLDAHLMRPD